MSDLPVPSPKPRSRLVTHLLRLLAGTALLLLVCVLLLARYANSPQFQDRVRRQVIATLSQATGGRVELQGFRWRLLHLEIEADGLTIHGLEAPQEAPYAHVDRLFLRAKILSFFEAKVGLHLLRAEHPVLHLIVYPDGSTNQPEPKTSRAGKPLTDTLFDLAVDRMEVSDGLVLFNQKSTPFDLAANNLGLTVAYRPAPARKDAYHLDLTVSDLLAHRGNLPAVRSRIDASADLGRNAAYLQSLRLQTPSAVLTASGSLTDFSSPAWKFTADGQVDLRAIEDLTAVPGLNRGMGTVRLTGQGDASGKFLIEGNARIQDGSYWTHSVQVSGVSATTRVRADERELRLAGLQAKLREGGSFEGELRVADWLGRAPSVPRNGRPARAPRSQGTVDVAVNGVTLNSILGIVASRRYQDLGFNTAVWGRAKADWVGAGDEVTVGANVKLAPSPSPLPGQVPLSGLVDAEYSHRSGSVQIRALEVHTPATSLSVTGSLGVDSESIASSLQCALTTTDLGEFNRTLSDLGLEEHGRKGVRALPVDLHGEAEFHGTVTGTLTAPDVKGHLLATNFTTLIFAADGAADASSSAAERSFQWDRLDATGEYSSQAIAIQQATVVRGRTILHAAGSLRAHRVTPRSFAFDRESAIDARVQVQDAPVTEILGIVGESLPVTGAASLDVHATGSIGDLGGGGHLQVLGGEIYGEPYRSLNADLQLAGSEIGISKLTLLQNGGQVDATGGYDFTAGRFHFDARGKGFELAHFKSLQKTKTPLGGRLEFTAQGSGTLDQPAMRAVAHLTGVTVAGEPMGGIEGEAHTERGLLLFNATNRLNGSKMAAGGEIELKGGYQARAQLDLAQLDIDPFLRLLNIQALTGHSSVGGQFKVSGPLKQPERLNGEGNISQFSVSLAGVPLHSESGLRLLLHDGVLHLDSLHILGEDTDLHAQGQVGLFERHDLQVHANGAVNLKLAQLVNPDITSSGRVDFTVDAGGTVERPDLGGQVRFTNVALSLGDLPNGLSQINGTLQFDQDRLQIKDLTAYTGGGQLKLGGYVAYRNGLYGDLTAAGKGIRIRYPQGVSSMADADLRLQGAQNNLLLSGNILLTRFAISPDVDLAGLTGPANSLAPPPDPKAPSNHVRLDVHITSAPELNFQNSFAKLAGDVDLRARGTLANPSVLGRINITEGSATFAGTQYQLQHGDLFFTNPVRINPNIDLDATARVENYDITIGVHGSASKLNVTYRSEPPLPQADIIALLALGRTEDEQRVYAQQQQVAGTSGTTNALLGGALNATVSSRVQKLFGVGSVKIDPTFVGTLGNSTARVTVEQQVSRNLTLTYATNVNSTAQQLIQAQINLTRTVSLVAVRDESGVFSMVVKVHRRLR